MMFRFFRLALFAGALGFTAACAPLGQRDAAPYFWRGACVGADWDALGYRDGVRGLRYAFWARAAECELTPPESAQALYDEGYDRGLPIYCTPASGFQAGSRNLAYEDVCPPELAPAFLAAYRRGLTAWSTQNAFDGYWFLGDYLAHPTRKLRDPPHQAPRPHRRHWRDRDDSRDGRMRRDRDDSHDWSDRDGDRRGRGDRDDSHDGRDRDGDRDRSPRDDGGGWRHPGTDRDDSPSDEPDTTDRAHDEYDGGGWSRDTSDGYSGFDRDTDSDRDDGWGGSVSDSPSYESDTDTDSDDDDDHEIIIAPSDRSDLDN